MTQPANVQDRKAKKSDATPGDTPGTTPNGTDGQQSADSKPTLNLQDQLDKLTAELALAELEEATLASALDKIPESKGAAAIRENTAKRLSTTQDRIKKLTEQRDALETRVKNAAVFDPFFEAVGEIAVPSELQKVEVKLPATIQIADVEARYNQARLAVAVFGPIIEASKTHLANLDEKVWDSMPALHLVTSESGSSIAVKFASGRTRSSSDSSGGQRGTPATYRVITTPDDYDGPGKAGDQFGAGTENADQTEYATRVEPIRFPAYVEKRKEGGGRVSPMNALKALGWGIEKI